MADDAVVDALVAEARERGWDPDTRTRALWRRVFDALLDPRMMVVVQSADSPDLAARVSRLEHAVLRQDVHVDG